MNSAQITINKINRQFTLEMYSNFYGTEIDFDLLDERKKVLFEAMTNIIHENDCFKIATSLATIWDNDNITIHILCQAIQNSF